jgi:hypothetical protein
MWDYGERAFFETLANLKRAGIAHPEPAEITRRRIPP